MKKCMLFCCAFNSFAMKPQESQTLAPREMQESQESTKLIELIQKIQILTYNKPQESQTLSSREMQESQENIEFIKLIQEIQILMYEKMKKSQNLTPIEMQKYEKSIKFIEFIQKMQIIHYKLQNSLDSIRESMKSIQENLDPDSIRESTKSILEYIEIPLDLIISNTSSIEENIAKLFYLADNEEDESLDRRRLVQLFFNINDDYHIINIALSAIYSIKNLLFTIDPKRYNDVLQNLAHEKKAINYMILSPKPPKAPEAPKEESNQTSKYSRLFIFSLIAIPSAAIIISYKYFINS